jgi:hypothetical protein
MAKYVRHDNGQYVEDTNGTYTKNYDGSYTDTHVVDSHKGEVKPTEDPTPQLKNSRVTVAGSNTDGKNLFMEVDVFDGEHNNRLFPVFPAGTTAQAITEYCKKLIETNPKVPAEISGMMQKTLFWDATEESWYMAVGNQKPVRLKDKNATVKEHKEPFVEHL